jgi:hypothetical protein
MPSRIASAGSAIGSYVQPSAGEVRGASSQVAQVTGPAQRTEPQALVHEILRSGKPFSRAGGGEVEIPAWFEAAARTMLASRGLGENISIAELTLIATAPATQVAASSRDESAPTPSGGTGAATAQQGEKPDIEKITAEVTTKVWDEIVVNLLRNGGDGFQ